MIVLKRMYQGQLPGSVLNCGTGVAQELIRRGIAEWEKNNEQNLRCDDGANIGTADAGRIENTSSNSVVRFRHGTESDTDSQPQNRRRGRPPKIRDANG